MQNSESSQDEMMDTTRAASVRMRPHEGTPKASEAPKSWRAIGGGARGEKWFSSDITPFENPGSLEVHMRRYDTESLLHRRALAAVRIEAPPALVWNLLTNYENMPKFMPHLMHTEYIKRYNAVESEASETIKRLRLRQVFVKCDLFHAIEESTAMDVVQKDDRTEIQFRVLQNPKFGALQGKWLVVPTEDSTATVLKFAIEGVVSNLGTDGTAKKVDPLNERIVFEEISAMLKQARDFMEGIASKEVPGALVKSETTDDQDESIRALKRELINLGFGKNNSMPTREQLRGRGGRHRNVIEQIENLGGFVKVAQLLDWSSAKTRPRGYWTVRTLELEIKNFIANTDDPNVRRNPQRMPSQKSLRDAGRADIVNALKRLGGAQKVAGSIGLEFGNKHSSARARGSGSKSSSGD
jgi:ribosome-associated toxin RatA of RatAB toxin-antitoxin module